MNANYPINVSPIVSRGNSPFAPRREEIPQEANEKVEFPINVSPVEVEASPPEINVSPIEAVSPQTNNDQFLTLQLIHGRRGITETQGQNCIGQVTASVKSTGSGK